MTEKDIKPSEIKWYEYIFKRVPEEDYVKWYHALILFVILFILLFIVFSIFEMQNYSDSYDKTSYTLDMFGNRKYKTIKGTEPDFYSAEIISLKISAFLSIFAYVTNYMYHFRMMVISFFGKIFSFF